MLLSVPTNVTVWLNAAWSCSLAWLPFALLGPVFEYAHKNLGKWRVVTVVIVGTNQRR